MHSAEPITECGILVHLSPEQHLGTLTVVPLGCQHQGRLVMSLQQGGRKGEEGRGGEGEGGEVEKRMEGREEEDRSGQGGEGAQLKGWVKKREEEGRQSSRGKERYSE